MVHCHLFVWILNVSQICLSKAIQPGFSVLSTHPHGSFRASLFYGASCPILDFFCLLVLAYRPWGFCRKCLVLCSSGLILVMSSPHRNPPFGANLVAWLALVVLMIMRHMSATTIRGLWNDEVYYLLRCHGAYRTPFGWHSEVLDRKSVHMNKSGLGVLPFGLEHGVSRILKVHSLLVNLKYKSGK